MQSLVFEILVVSIDSLETHNKYFGQLFTHPRLKVCEIIVCLLLIKTFLNIVPKSTFLRKLFVHIDFQNDSFPHPFV